jgi:hypothetical protein
MVRRRAKERKLCSDRANNSLARIVPRVRYYLLRQLGSWYRLAAILLVASGVAEQVEVGLDGHTVGEVEPANVPQPISVTFWNRHTKPVTIKWEGRAPNGEGGGHRMVPVIEELAVDARASINTFVGNTFSSKEKGTHRFIHSFFVEHGNITTIVCEKETEVKTRCVRHDYETPALIPGQISKVFAEIPTKFPDYQAEVGPELRPEYPVFPQFHFGRRDRGADPSRRS